MFRSWLRSRTLPALILLAVAGCVDAGLPTGAEPPAPGALSAARSTGELEKVSGVMPAFFVEAVIGAEGGSLGVPGYTLTVPRGAVQQPTHFTFESVASGSVEVRLTATSLDSRIANDVGSVGFRVPVLLSFSYEPSGGMPRWARMVVAYVRDDGSLERVPSTINPPMRLITGRLGHFSQYALATD